MKTLGNIIWLLLGGFITALVYILAGVVCCVTIILIPLGVMNFKMARLALWPFGKVVDGNFEEHPKANAFWLAFCGISAWLWHSIIGILLCVTIIGIPFAKQNFKLAKFALRPFGATVEKY